MTQTPTIEPQAPRARISLPIRIIFAVSVALNLLVLGVVAGAWWRGFNPAVAVLHATPQAALFRELPEPMRREMRQEAIGQVDRVMVRDLRIKRELLEVLRAEPFDGAAVDALMLRQAKALMEGHSKLRTIWIDKLQRMTPEERAAYADRVDRAMSEPRAKPRPKP